jgi:hypothetical protein
MMKYSIVCEPTYPRKPATGSTRIVRNSAAVDAV